MKYYMISLIFSILLDCSLYAGSNSDSLETNTRSLTAQKKAEIRTREEIRLQKLLYQQDDLAKAWKSTLESFYEMQLKEYEAFHTGETLTYIQDAIEQLQSLRDKSLRRCYHRKEQYVILEQYKQSLSDLLSEISFKELLRWAKTTRKESQTIKTGFEDCGFDPEVYKRVLYLKNEEWIYKSFETIESIRMIFQDALAENEIRGHYVQSGRLDSLSRKFRRFMKSGKQKNHQRESQTAWQ